MRRSVFAAAVALGVAGCAGLVAPGGGEAPEAGVEAGVVDVGAAPDLRVVDAAADAGAVDVGVEARERCDGLDDDDDGVIDEGHPGLGGACVGGVGVCRGEGVVVCDAEGIGTVCRVRGAMGVAEVCNGGDDDCDGNVDEGFAGLGDSCMVGMGACAVWGTVSCTGDGMGAACDAVLPADRVEQCNGVDDDCDEIADEGLDGMACETGEAGVCGAGLSACRDGVAACERVTGPAAEVCDGLDNDCNGVVDDAPGVGEPCVVGVGACVAGGLMACGAGGLGCDAVAGAPGAEVCDGIDNDCNGVVDDTPLCVPAGVQQNLDAAQVAAAGWQVCHSSRYSDGGIPIAQVQANCGGTHLMLACRPVGSPVYALAAAGEFAEVFRDVGNGAGASHQHNGVTWYYSPFWSWGFAPGGLPVNRNSCDYNDGGQISPELRMCVHTDGGALQIGYRCGANDLNNAGGWERLVLRR
ncbi:MAG: putative metal-binding motif-containing protein [Myxococcales bacterium]|nr:putative metal-binding motif-containing protein [Myxococcales bacterium]